ncbi:MAG TPA: hypothetical protein VHG72_16880 [Polyangia bacterium]|nr:hypothetical protein [Polyangia bacterium]
MTPTLPRYEGGRTAMRIALGLGLAALAINIVGFAVTPARALFSWLIAVIYVMTVVLGLMGVLVITHAMNAGWPTVVRRLAEAAMPIMPLLAVLFVPVLLGIDQIYPWTHIGTFRDPAMRKVLEHKAPYLNPPFFVVRTVFYLLIWSLFAILLRRWSLATDPEPHRDHRPRLRALSAAMGPIMGITLTAAATDWIMSLAPEWVSYIFGFYFMALSLLGGVALLTLLAVLSGRRNQLSVTVSHCHALGRVLFTFLVLWAYTAYFNYFITWIANKPAEARWFVQRSVEPFRAMSLFIIFGHFGFPFLMLITYVVRRSRRLLAFMAAWLLAAQYLEVHWLIAPERNLPSVFDWWDPVAVLAVGGLSMALALQAQHGRLLAPIFDRRFPEAARYESW